MNALNTPEIISNNFIVRLFLLVTSFFMASANTYAEINWNPPDFQYYDHQGKTMEGTDLSAFNVGYDIRGYANSLLDSRMKRWFEQHNIQNGDVTWYNNIPYVSPNDPNYGYAYFDLFMPTGVDLNKIPLVVYYHGGGFVLNSELKVSTTPLIELVKNEKYAVASVHYPLLNTLQMLQCRSGVLPTMEQARQFILKIKQHEAKFKIDRNKVVVAGNSAGAMTSLYIATHPDAASKVLGVALIDVQSSMAVADLKEIFGFSYGNPWIPKRITSSSTLNMSRPLNNLGLDEIQLSIMRDECPPNSGLNLSNRISSSTPPVWIYQRFPNWDWAGPLTGLNIALHHPKFAKIIVDKLNQFGVPVSYRYFEQNNQLASTIPFNSDGSSITFEPDFNPFIKGIFSRQ